MGENNKTAALTSAFFDFIINLASVYLAFLVLDDSTVKTISKTILAIATICTVVSIIVYFVCDIYSHRRFVKLHREILRMLGAQFFILSVLLLMILIFTPTKRSYFLLAIISVGISTAALVLKKVLITKVVHSLRVSKRHVKTVLIVGNNPSAVEFERQINNNLHFGFSIIGCVCDDAEPYFEKLGNYDQLDSVLAKTNPDEVILAMNSDEESKIQELLSICDNNGVRSAIVPSTYRFFKSKCQVDMVGNLPIINTRNIPLDNFVNAAMKRLMDIVVSLLVIVITSPIMLFAFIGVKISSKGPAIFKQTRVGKNNKEFTMYKFRSMRVNLQEQTGWTTMDDRRKTRFGAFIRKLGIDELPQFFNVLFGSMSIIGPRPELPAYVEEYSKKIPLYKIKHQVKPGITGLAQIYGFRGDTSIEGRIELDIKYIEEWSLFNDIKILLITPFKMFNRNEKYVK